MSVHHRLRLLAFPMRARAAHRSWPDVGSPGSRPRSFCTCQVLRPRRAVRTLRWCVRNVLLSALESESAPGDWFSRLNGWPALPCRRFVGVLTDANARLGADVDRYSFIVVDLHHLLLAGLPAHFESYMVSQAVRSLWVMSGLQKYV